MEQLRDRARRHSVRLDATVVRDNGAALPTIVTDLSIDGCCLIGPFAIGERLTVKIPKIGSLHAEIRWTLMGRAGARFISDTQRQLDARGAAAIEYALIAACIALALVAAISELGGSVGNQFNNVGQSLPSGIEYDL